MNKVDESDNTFNVLSVDVLIVGAGMVGAAIACGLAVSGLNIAIVDNAAPQNLSTKPTPELRVSAISYTSEQILKNLGAWDHIDMSRLCPYRRLGVAEDTGKHAIFDWLPGVKQMGYTEFDCASIDKSHLGYIAENGNIQYALHQAMKKHNNIAVYCPDEIAEFVRHDGSSMVRLESGVKLEATLVVGADGANSKVRTQFNVASSREKYAQEAFVCSISYKGKQEDITWQTFYPSGPRAFLPFADMNESQFASLVWYDHPDRINALMKLSDAALVDEIRQCFPAKIPVPFKLELRGRFPLYKSHAQCYYKEGMVLAGDAAHTINPLAGQGVNLGFMDAAVLVECLVQSYTNGEGVASISALEQYQTKRRIDNQAMMNIMDAFYYGFSNDHLPFKLVRHAGLSIANKMDFAKNKVMQYATGVSGDLPKLARPA